MIFLQPELLWGLLAAPLPVLIHWLNRLRYRRISWAASLFLRAATRTSTRRSKIRHWLILACRVLALSSLLLLLTRPLVGGWFGVMLAAPPDLIVVALDRSASMETPGDDDGRSRRQLALDALAQTPPDIWKGARLRLVDSATLRPVMVASPAALPHLEAASGTDAGAEIAALVRAAAESLAAERPGRAEIWLISDLQASSWKPDDPQWRGAAAALASLPQDVMVRLFASRGRPSSNRTLQWVGSRRVSMGEHLRVEIAVAVRAEGDLANEPVMMSWNALGVRSPTEVRPAPQFGVIQRSFEWPANEPVFWGSVELPPDANPSDNCVFFAVARPAAVRAVMVAEHEDCARRLRLAVSPFGTGRVEVVRAQPGLIGEALTGPVALIAIQGVPLTEAEAAVIGTWVGEGTTALWMPPTQRDADSGDWKWRDLESATDTPWRVTAWNRRDGPLQDGADGVPLPMDRLAVHRRRSADGAAADHVVHALLGDGMPLVLSKTVGLGRSYALATLPLDDWSTLGDGWIWVPMLHRMIDEGARRWEAAHTAVCGRWRPAAEEVWRPVESVRPDAHSLRAGLFRWGDRFIALNRPPEEDDSDTITPEVVNQRLAPVRVVLAGDPADAAGEPTRAEVSLWLAVVAIVALIAESWLLGGEYRPQAP